MGLGFVLVITVLASLIGMLARTSVKQAAEPQEEDNQNDVL
ncbi:hypothetical protein [Alicyclobacillus ferrooxydans]|nr:hypothetical protein [Alicyclobacillus ferrooxydans]